MRIISEQEFKEKLLQKLSSLDGCLDEIRYVTGPGRSGAVASVYASHILGIPFVPYKQIPKSELGAVLIVDTATESGKTMRKAIRYYEKHIKVFSLSVYQEPPRVAFWYESDKPQHYRHERKCS